MAVTEAACPAGVSADTGVTGTAVGAGRAALELGMKRGEFELAVHLGIVRITAERTSGRPRVSREEIDRIRSEDGFPAALHERVRTVGMAEGARLLGISPVRFARLARAGCLTPVTFYVNRYRAVVWLYLAQELLGFAARAPQLLVGNTPVWMRTRLAEGIDWRARNWRAQRIERLLDRTTDPWRRAAVLAGALDPVQLAEAVDDPYERAHLAEVRPQPVFGPPGSVAAREALTQLMQADDADEILWRRTNLMAELDEARASGEAPRSGAGHRPQPAPGRDLDPCAGNAPTCAAVPDALAAAAPGLLARLGRLGLRRRATGRQAAEVDGGTRGAAARNSAEGISAPQS